MTNNIDTKIIGNRKIILEIRFDPVVSMLDRRGKIVDEVISSAVINNLHWEVGPSEVVFRDSIKIEDAQNIISVRFNRINVQSYKVDSVDSFYERFIKLYDMVLSVIGESPIKRIGCRIIGTYHVKSTTFESLLANFIGAFPERFKLSNYPANDLLFHLTYNGGMYEIGPVNINDNFYDREFNCSFCKKHIGVAIDTDNFITDEQTPLDKKSLIKDVYTLSLSVEKDIYSMLADM